MTPRCLELTPNDPKALFRRCQAYEAVDKVDSAYKDARECHRVDPNNPSLQPILVRLHKAVSEKASLKLKFSRTNNFLNDLKSTHQIVKNGAASFSPTTSFPTVTFPAQMTNVISQSNTEQINANEISFLLVSSFCSDYLLAFSRKSGSGCGAPLERRVRIPFPIFLRNLTCIPFIRGESLFRSLKEVLLYELCGDRKK